ncbi:MAG: calcium/sodium antiporter [Gemmatimonadota bacterium]
MWLDLLILAAGLTLLVLGGDALVRGASDLARRMGVAPVIVGLTVVAFGTSTPELVVNVAAALRGSTEIGFGNVVGSNVANIGLILGVSALITPLAIHRTLVVREIPMMLLACGVAITLGWQGPGGASGAGFGRSDGVILLLLFSVFLYYTFADALRQRHDAFLDAVAPQEGPGPLAPPVRAIATMVLLMTGGLALLIAGGEFAVRGATGFARGIGVAEAVIGLTIVAVGTSLPEFATSALAAYRGQSDVAVGNIVGSNIYNMLFIWGISVTIAPSPVPAGGMVDLIVMTAFSLLLVPLVLTQNRLSRAEGALILAGYVGYIGWLVVR